MGDAQRFVNATGRPWVAWGGMGKTARSYPCSPSGVTRLIRERVPCDMLMSLPTDDRSLPQILPPGTKVVLRAPAASHSAGAVGVIIRSPGDDRHAYRVRFNDGQEASLGRDDLVVLKHFQRDGGAVELPLARYDFNPHVILRCVVGSRAYGLSDESSDTDYRGIYLPPADLHWSLFGVPEQIEDDATQEVYWEIGKFLILAL